MLSISRATRSRSADFLLGQPEFRRRCGARVMDSSARGSSPPATWGRWRGAEIEPTSSTGCKRWAGAAIRRSAGSIAAIHRHSGGISEKDQRPHAIGCCSGAPG